MIKSLLALFLLATLGCAAKAVDLKQIEAELTGKGAVGWIHGAVADRHLYVFTYRNPQNFFDYIQMSLVAEDPEIIAKLATLNRHDKVLVQGEFLDNPSPQKHIAIKSIELVTKYHSPVPLKEHEYEAKIPDELTQLDHASFLVHAVAGDGHILVLEYKDQILPAFIKNESLTKGLYRNDVVELHFKIQRFPHEPTHLTVDESGPHPILVTDSIAALHGKPGSITGALIMFPKSPEIKFNVFAVQQKLPEGLTRQYTLVNFDSPETFLGIREALQLAWDRHPDAYVNGRNKLISEKITVKATGTFNEVDASQANPQILLKDLSAIEILE